MLARKASKRAMSRAKPAAASWPPQRRRCSDARGEAADGGDPGRGADAALAAGDDEDGAVEALDQRAGDEAHDARVPGVVGDDDRRRLGIDLRHRALQHGVLDAAPLAVVVVEPRGDRERPLLVGDAEQLEREVRLAEAAGGVEPWREAERDVPGGRRLPQAAPAPASPARPATPSPARRSSPSLTSARFSPSRGATSAIVPMVARSANSTGSGSPRRRCTAHSRW